MPSDITNPEPALRPVGGEELAAWFTRYEEEQPEDQDLQSMREWLAAVAKSQTGGAPTASWRSKFLPRTAECRGRDLGFVVVPHHGSPRPRPAIDESAEEERHEKEIERLRKEVDRLTIQNELLQTRVAEQRRSLAREARNADKLHAELVAVREQNARFLSMQDRYLTLLSDRGRANDALVTKMACEEDGLIRMHESYDGQVQHVGENTALVLFDVDGQLVEQTYEKEQFKDGKLPAPGTCVRVLVFVVEYEPKSPSIDEPERATSDKPSQRKSLTGPVEF